MQYTDFYAPCNNGDEYLLMYDIYGFTRGDKLVATDKQYTLGKQHLVTFKHDGPNQRVWEFDTNYIDMFLVKYTNLSKKDQFLYQISGKLPVYIDWWKLIPPGELTYIFRSSQSMPPQAPTMIDQWWTNYYSEIGVEYA